MIHAVNNARPCQQCGIAFTPLRASAHDYYAYGGPPIPLADLQAMAALLQEVGTP